MAKIEKPAPEASTLTLVMVRDTSLTADWPAFREDIISSVIQFFVKDPIESIASGMSGLIKLASSVDLAKSPGELAWRLSARALGWALDQVCYGKIVDRKEISKLLRKVLFEDDDSQGKGIAIPYQFLERPTTLPLYRSFREALTKSSLYPMKNDVELRSFQFRLDAAFDRAIFEIWSRKPPIYQDLAKFLQIPGATVAERSLNWSAYKKSIVYEFEVKPIFGQEEEGISLSQLYVPLRGYWPKDPDKSYRGDAKDSPENFNVVTIDSDLDNWVDHQSPEEWLRLIGGGPGSGKSTTLKAFACRMAKREDWRTLFIPLQYINFDNDLRESINDFYCGRTDSAFTQPPLLRDSVEDGPPLILIFDGLDELAAPGESANNIVGTFANRLNSLVGSLTGDKKRRIKVVVSGRMPAFQAAKRYLTPSTNASLEAYGFLPTSSRNSEDLDPLWLTDQRKIWWTQYANIKGISTEIPPALSSNKLQDIAHEPLLCYLLALAGYATDHWEEAAENRNRIYESLIGSVYDRVWGEGAIKRQGAGRSLSRGHFDKLMETIALAAWQAGDTRVASLDGFEKAIKITNAEEAWAAFREDNGQDVNNLAMNFYLKSSEKDHRGFEFTHKSFGEYLASRALIGVAFEASIIAERRLDHALSDWIAANKSGFVSTEILQFMRDQMRLVIADVNNSKRETDVLNLKKSFQALAEKVELDGFPPVQSAQTWRSCDIEQRQSQISIWCIINSCARALALVGNIKDAVVDVNLSSNFDFAIMFNRLVNNMSPSVFSKCLSYIVLKDQYIFSTDIYSADFEGARLDSCIFIACDISESTFAGASLNNVTFSKCDFNEVSLEGCISSRLQIYNSKINNIDISNVESECLIVSHETILKSDIADVQKIIKICYLDDDRFDLSSFLSDQNEKLEIIRNLRVLKREKVVSIDAILTDV